MQLQWNITSVPAPVRRAAILMADALYPIEVFLWPAAVILVAREHRASGTRTI